MDGHVLESRGRPQEKMTVGRPLSPDAVAFIAQCNSAYLATSGEAGQPYRVVLHGAGMKSIKASSKGQMVIPKTVREALDIRSGTELSVELLSDKAFKVTVEKGDHVEQARRLAGCLSQYAKGGGSARSDDKAIGRAVAEDDTRVRDCQPAIAQLCV